MTFTWGLLERFLPGWEGLPFWLQVALAAIGPATVLITFMALGPLAYVYAETKIAGFMQDRIGPKRVGPHGLLQTVADAVKLLFKEAVFPRGVDKLLFVIGPCLVVVGAFMPFVAVPFSVRLVTADLNVGLFYVVAIASLSTVGIIMSSWASNNKYALFGGMRSAAQIVSYEIPAVMTLLIPVMVVGSLSLPELVQAQAGGIHHWFFFRWFPLMPIAFLVFFTAGLAECNRTPFDIPEAESELVAGFHTEYSGLFFALFFMAEYTEMFVVSAVAAVLFLGGYLAPIPALQSFTLMGETLGLGPFWLIAKAWALMFVMMWLRWTLPRLRVDQLMYVAWKVLLPISMALVVVFGVLTLLPATKNGFPWDRWAAWILTPALLLYLVVGAVQAVQWSQRRIREMAA